MLSSLSFTNISWHSDGYMVLTNKKNKDEVNKIYNQNLNLKHSLEPNTYTQIGPDGGKGRLVFCYIKKFANLLNLIQLSLNRLTRHCILRSVVMEPPE